MEEDQDESLRLRTIPITANLHSPIPKLNLETSESQQLNPNELFYKNVDL